MGSWTKHSETKLNSTQPQAGSGSPKRAGSAIPIFLTNIFVSLSLSLSLVTSFTLSLHAFKANFLNYYVRVHVFLCLLSFVKLILLGPINLDVIHNYTQD